MLIINQVESFRLKITIQIFNHIYICVHVIVLYKRLSTFTYYFGIFDDPVNVFEKKITHNWAGHDGYHGS